jgi:hypothetical protein
MPAAMTAKSRTGFIIAYAGCRVTWGSKIQRGSTLSSTESEYVTISEAFRVLLPLMDLLEGVVHHRVPVELGPPLIRWKTFEDNSGALQLARLPNMRPHTRHINVKYHHFREAVAKGRITIEHVSTTNQLADELAKNLPRVIFVRLRKVILG